MTPYDPAAIEALITELGAVPGEYMIGLDVVGGIATLLAAMHRPRAGARGEPRPTRTTGGEAKSDPATPG